MKNLKTFTILNDNNMEIKSDNQQSMDVSLYPEQNKVVESI